MTVATGVAAKVIAWVNHESAIHYQEGRDPNGNWNNREKYAAMVPGLSWVNDDESSWCDVFACATYLIGGGLKLVADFPVSAACSESETKYKQMNRYSEYPALGAQIFYNVSGLSGAHHTGIVVAYDANTVKSVEGNTNTNGSSQGDGVYTHTNQRRIDRIRGYGYPKFPEGMVSADPAWAKGHL